jgi:hypothetical protein
MSDAHRPLRGPLTELSGASSKAPANRDGGRPPEWGSEAGPTRASLRLSRCGDDHQLQWLAPGGHRSGQVYYQLQLVTILKAQK